MSPARLRTAAKNNTTAANPIGNIVCCVAGADRHEQHTRPLAGPKQVQAGQTMRNWRRWLSSGADFWAAKADKANRSRRLS